MYLALASCQDLPDWEVDDKPFHDELSQRGHRFVNPTWNDPTIDWSKFDAVLVRTTWDYTAHINDFISWAEAVSQKTKFFNPIEIIRWNTSKTYLRDLEKRGVPIAPSIWLDDKSNIKALIQDKKAKKWFMKPIIGACAESTLRFTLSEVEDAEALLARCLPKCGMILQPYIESVETVGEWSILLFNGQVSHAVQKIPVCGDYRVQDDFGAVDHSVSPPAELSQLAQRVCEVLPFKSPLLYARVDALFWDGHWVLNELELIEPSLFFRHSPKAAGLLVDALEHCVNHAKV